MKIEQMLRDVIEPMFLQDVLGERASWSAIWRRFDAAAGSAAVGTNAGRATADAAGGEGGEGGEGGGGEGAGTPAAKGGEAGKGTEGEPAKTKEGEPVDTGKGSLATGVVPDATKKIEDGKAKAPETYELKVPEGSLLSESVKEEIAAFARSRGFSNEHAQDILNNRSEAHAAYVDGQAVELDQRSEGWVKQVKAHPKIGGDNFDRSIEGVRRLVNKYGNDELKNILNESRTGNHPAVVEFLSAIADDLGMHEDTVAAGLADPGKREKSDEEKMFPSMFNADGTPKEGSK